MATIQETRTDTLYRRRLRLCRAIERDQAAAAEIDAELRRRGIEPRLMTSCRRTLSPLFRTGELTRLVLAELREAGEPLPIRVIARRLFAMKGVTLPEPALRRAMKKRLQKMFLALDKRGVMVRVGEGAEARRGLL